MVFLYDGTFPGLLTVLARAVSWGEIPERIDIEGDEGCGLFEEGTPVATDLAKAARFLAIIEERTSRTTARNLFCLHASDRPESGMLAYRYLEQGRRLGPRLDHHLTHPDVLPVHRLVHKVRREAHRLKGLLRFRELADGLLYAPLEPDHAVLPLLAPHFCARFPGENWLIHDLRRGLGILGTGGTWESVPLALDEPPVFAANEVHYQHLWRRFFGAIAIPERRSSRRQQQFMPKKYWRHLVEMK